MNFRKGFTLLELLAVIVILAIIALIATPIILNIIKNVEKTAALRSTDEYIDSVKNYILLSMLQGDNLKDGTYYVNGTLKNKLEMNGITPTNGLLKIEKNAITYGEFCINNYSIKWNNDSSISDENYCNKEYKIKVGLYLGKTKYEREITLGVEENASFEDTSFSTDEYTTYICNNGAIGKYENGIFSIENITFEETNCKVYTSFDDALNNADNSSSYVSLLNDSSIDSEIIIESNKDIKLNLNGKTITNIFDEDKSAIYNKGNLTIFDETNLGTMKTNYRLITTTGNLTINSGNFIRENSEAIEGWLVGTCSGSTLINDGTFNTDKTCAVAIFPSYCGEQYESIPAILTINSGNITSKDSYAIRNDSSGIININNGIISSNNTYAIYNRSTNDININGGIIEGALGIKNELSGSINISSVNNKIYVASLESNITGKNVYWYKGIINTGSGNINIKGQKADKCTEISEDTTSGICIFAYYRTILNEGGTTGTINIDVSTIVSKNYIALENYDGISNVKNSYISGIYGISNQRGIMNICNSTINGTTRDISNYSTGYMYYNSSVNLINNTLYDATTNSPSHIILDETITCN